MIPVGHQVVACVGVVGKQFAQRRVAEQRGGRIREPPTGVLQAAVRVEDFRTDYRDLWVLFGVVDQQLQRGWDDLRVGVQDKQVLASCGARRQIVSLREAEILLADQQAHFGELFFEHLHAAVAGGVVQHDDLVGEARGMRQNRTQRRTQRLPRVPVHNLHGQQHLCHPQVGYLSRYNWLVEPKTSLLNLLRGILPEEQAERVAPEMATLLGEMVQAEVARQLETLIRELRADYHRIDERLARLVQVTEQHSEQIARLVQVTEQHSEQIAALRATTERHSEQIAENTRAIERLVQVTEQHSEQIAALRATTERHSEQIAENTRAIAELRATTERHSEQIAENTRAIAELRAVVEKHSEQIAENTRAIAELRAVVEKHSEQIAENTRAIAELRAVVEKHSEQIAENTRAIAELRAVVEKHSEQIARNTQAIERLERAVEELVKAEQRLTRRTDDIARQLGGISMNIGYFLENEAYEALPPLLERDYGVRVLTPLTRDFVEDDKGNEYEVNIFGEGERDGEQLLIVGECKMQLSKQEIDRFLRRKIKPVQRIFSGRTLFPVMVAHTITTKRVQRYAQEQGVALYLSYQFRRANRSL
jgi:ABC-type transporter Mla subunit MlaD